MSLHNGSIVALRASDAGYINGGGVDGLGIEAEGALVVLLDIVVVAVDRGGNRRVHSLCEQEEGKIR